MSIARITFKYLFTQSKGMASLTYPSPERIIEINALALELIRIKKADRSEVLSRAKILEVLRECEEKAGEVYDKAVVLLKGLIQKHPFASGNRRTAFIVAKEFILTNGHSFGIKDNPQDALVMQGIRKEWQIGRAHV